MLEDYNQPICLKILKNNYTHIVMQGRNQGNCLGKATPMAICPPLVNVWGKRLKLPQLTHESFLTIDHSCKIFFWYLPNWTSTNLWCVVLYVTYSTTHQRLVEVQFGRYQKNILQEGYMVKKLSCVICGSLKRFPHTFTNSMYCTWLIVLHTGGRWKFSWADIKKNFAGVIYGQKALMC